MTSKVYDQAARRYAQIRSGRAARKTVAATAVAVAAVSAIAIGLVLAYLSDSDSANNVLGIAGNDIEIVERFPESPAPVEEGEVDKVVQIRNTGTAACFVRVALELTDDDALEYAELGILSEAWTDKFDDGYYYTIAPLEAGETTPPLLDGVTIGAAPNGGYRDFGIIVYAESAQATDPSTGTRYASGIDAFAALAAAEGGDDHA